MSLFIILNFIISLIETGISISAFVKPELWSGSAVVSQGERLYTNFYVLRAVAFGLAVAVIPFFWQNPAVALFILAAGLVQAGDLAIALTARDKRIIGGAILALLVHTITAILILIH